MSGFESSPPSIISSVFNPAYFNTSNDILTTGKADARYLKISSAEASYISGITEGIAQADKAIVLDSLRDISNINDINSTGRFSMVNTDYGLSHRYSNGGTCELISYNSGSDATFGTYTNHPFSLTTNFINRLTINAGGNVSIGNANNTYKLDVEGTLMTNGLKIRSTGSLTYDTPSFTIRTRTGAGFDSGLQIGPDSQGLLNTSNIAFWSDNFTTPILYLSSYNQACVHLRPLATDIGQSIPDVGMVCGADAIFRSGVIISSLPISNTNNRIPSTKLRVIGDSNYVDGSYQKVFEACNQTYTNTLSIQCSTTADSPVFLGTTNASQLRFGTNNTTRMTINGSYVGIGTSNPRCPLEVSGSQLVGLNFDMLNTVYRKRTDNTSTIAETSTGTVSYNFSIWCSEYIYSKAIVQVSDRRMKTDIVDMDFKRVERFFEVMKPKTYKFKSNLTRTEHGLVAQEVVKEGFLDLISMMPNEELDVEDDEADEADVKGYQLGIDYQKVTMLNMSMVQSLINRIKDLELIVDKLTSKPAIDKWLKKN